MTSSMASLNGKVRKNGSSGAALHTPPPILNNPRSNAAAVTPPTVGKSLSPPPPATQKRARPPEEHTPTGLSSPISHLPPKPFYLEPTIESIKAKYGDIDKDCDLKSKVMRKGILSSICNVLKELQELTIEELNITSLDKYYSVVNDAVDINIDLKWLSTQLDSIKMAINSNVGVKELVAQRDVQKKKLIEQQEELKALNAKKRKVMEEMEMAITSKRKEMVVTNVAIRGLDRDIASGTVMFGHYKCYGMLDGLL